MLQLSDWRRPVGLGLNKLSGYNEEEQKEELVVSFNTGLSGHIVPAAFMHQLKSSIKEKL